ncbi:hypothetical protein TrRE_jg2096, partial [Triparma retinervis]
KISKVNSDGTVNVDFNDGDKDRYIDMKSVKLLDSGNISDASNSETDSPSFSKGDKVECRYQRKSKYYAGTITKVHRDGTFDVSYDSPNKNKERNVNQKYIKARDDSPPSSPASSSRSTSPRSGRSKSPKKRKNKKSEDEMRRARIEKLEGKKSKSPSKRGRRRSPSPDSDSASSDSSSEPLHQDFVENDKVKCCYYRSSSSSYSKPKKQSKFLSAKIRRANRNSTYKVEFTSGDRATIDNVPAKYIKLSSQSPSRSPSPSRKRSKSWDNLLALANYHYDDSNRNGSRPSLASAIKSSRGDDHKKLEKLIGRSNLDDYQDKFEQYDMGRNDELELEDVVEAFDSLGRRCSLKEVKSYLRTAKIRSRTLDFMNFMKCYATMFFAGDSAGSGDDSGSDSDSGRNLRRKNMDTFLDDEATDLQQWASILGDKQLQKLEDVFSDHATPLLRADGSTSSRVGIRVRELRTALRDLNRDCSASTLSAFLTSSSLKPGDVLSLADFAYTFHALFGSGGVDNVFSGAATRSGPFGAFDKRTASTSHSQGRSLSLSSIAQTAAAIFSNAVDWEGKPEQHLSLVNKLAVGRGDAILNALRRGRDAFEELDEDDYGTIPLDSTSDWLSKALPSRDPKKDTSLAKVVSDFTRTKSGKSSSKAKKVDSDEEDSGAKSKSSKKGSKKSSKKKNKNDSDEENKNGNDSDEDEVRSDGDEADVQVDLALPELFEGFGFLFENEGDGDATSGYNTPSVPTAFAELRLHNKASDVRDVAETVRQFLTDVTNHPHEVKFFKINSGSNPYASKVGKFKGGESLMLACGFSKAYGSDAKSKKLGATSSSSFFFTLNGGQVIKSLGAKVSKKPSNASKSKRGKQAKDAAASNPAAERKNPFVLEIQSKIDDVEAELKALDGVPSVASAIRTLREGNPADSAALPVSLRQVYFAVEQCLQCVSNLLKNPKDSRLHRIRAGNPAFQRTLGRFYGAAALMAACGFEAIEGGSIYALKRLGGSLEDQEFAKSVASSAGIATGPLATFKFPDLDQKTIAFLYRKRADLLQASETISNLIDSSDDLDGGQDVATRAKLDKLDSEASDQAKSKAPGGRGGSAAKASKGGKGKSGKGSKGGGSSNPLTSELELFLKGRTGVQRAQLAMLKEAFDAFDSNKDNFIDAADLKTYWRNKGESSSDARIADFIRERDINNDGLISFEEFAVSYSSLLQPETGAWASVEKGGGRGKNKRAVSTKGKPTAESGEIDPADVDDGATPVAAAFGALRLCATIPQCLTAVKTVETLIGKIVDVPSAKSYWRIKINDPSFHGSVGRFYGGIALMKAFGFNLEENGSALALADKGNGHARWERPPQGILDSLKANQKELQQHMNGLLSPEVSDVAAVSSAVARLRNPQTNEATSALLVVETAVFYMENIIKSPSDQSVRIINTSNLNFQRRIAAFEGGIALLVACGFREDTDSGNLVFPSDGDIRYLKARKLELETGLGLLQKFARHEAMVKERVKRKDDKREGRSKSPSKGKRSASRGKSRDVSRGRSKSPTKRGRDKGQTAASSGPADNNAVKKALLETKIVMEKNVEQIKAASDARVKEAEKRADALAREVQDLHAKLDKTIPRRDASTIQRMMSEDKKKTGKAAATFGLNSTAFKGGKDVKSRAKSGPSASGKSKSAGGKATKGKAVATTTLKAHAEAGATKLNVDTTEGFAVGHRVRIGEKKNAEERWVVSFGSIILDSPLKNAHMSGTSVISLGPPANAVQQKAFDRSWITYFIAEDIIQTSIVEPAIMQGEKIVLDRKAQKKYERRKIDKHIITCAPAFVKTLSTGDKSTSTAPGVLAMVSKMGKILSSLPSTGQLVRFDEGFSFSQLNLIFDSLDTDGKGFVTKADVSAAANMGNEYLSILCADGNVNSQASLDDFFSMFEPTIVDNKHAFTWRSFVALFRHLGDSNESTPDESSMRTFHKELWARALSDYDVTDIVRSFVLYDASATGELDFDAATSAFLELSHCFDENLPTPFKKDDVEELLRTIVQPQNHNIVKVNQYARLYVEAMKVAKQPLLWKKTARAAVKAIFDSHSNDGYTVEGEEKLVAFFSEIQTNPGLRTFLSCSVSQTRNPELLTFGDCLDDLCSTDKEIQFVSYNKHVKFIFSSSASGDIFVRPSTSCSLANTDSILNASASPPVHEIIVHETTSTMYILYQNGIVQTWNADDASPHVLTNSIRVITHEPTPDPSSNETSNKRNESQTENTKWRQEVALDPSDTSQSSSSTSQENVDAEFLASKFATQLLSMTPRCDIMMFDESSRSLLFNTTSGDRCVRFHEPTSFRRTHRVRLSLPNMPYFDHGLFDVGPGGYDNANGVTHRVSSHLSDETAGSMQRYRYLPHSSVILGSVVGSPTILAFCSVTGLPLARLCGHSLPPQVKDGVAVTSLIATVNYNGHAASGGVDGDIRIWDLGTELLPSLKRRWGPARSALMGGDAKSEFSRFGDIASYEDSMVARSTMSKKKLSIFSDPAKLEKFSSLRNSIKRSMDERAGEEVWKLGKITAIVDALVAQPSLALQTAGHQDNFLMKSVKPFVEVTFDDGSTHFNVPHKLIRNLDEMKKRGKRGPDFDRTEPVVVFVEDAGTIVPLNSAVGERVAVWTTKTKISDYVVSLFSHVDASASYDAPVGTFVRVLESLLAREFNNDEAADNLDFSMANVSSAVANMALEDLDELARAFDDFNTGYVDVNLFATWVAQGTLLHQSNIGWRTRAITSSRVIRKAHNHGVSKLAYLPHSMLITSGGINDSIIKFWDPVAHRHRLVRPDCGPVVRWRGESGEGGYQSLPEEWTDAGSPYAEVCSVDILEALKAHGGAEFNQIVSNEFGDVIEEDLASTVTVTPVTFSPLSVPTLLDSVITVRCDDTNSKAALEIDLKNGKNSQQKFLSDPDDFVSSGTKSGFLYCMSNGELFAVESPSGFDKRFVLMDKEILTVLVPLSKPDHPDEADEARKVYANRTRIRRVAYVSIKEDSGVSLKELKASAAEIQALSKKAPQRALMSLGVTAVVFVSDGDDDEHHPLKDDEKMQLEVGDASSPGHSFRNPGMRTAAATVVSINDVARTVVVAPESLYYPGAVSQITIPQARIVDCQGEVLSVGARVSYGVAASVSFQGSSPSAPQSAAEILTCEVITSSKKDPKIFTRRLVAFAVGRTTVRVKASDFDRSNSDASLISSAGVAFSQRFKTAMQRFRALSPRSIGMEVRTAEAKRGAFETAVRNLQSAVIDEPEEGAKKDNHRTEAVLKTAFSTLLAIGTDHYPVAAMFEVSAALSDSASLLWDSSGGLAVTKGGGMGPLCESLASLYGSRGGAATITWENMRDFVESACSRVLSNNIFVESTYLIASSSLLLPRPPFRTSPEAFARNVGINNPSMVFVSANQLEAVTLGSAVEVTSTPTLPLLLDSLSFADVLSTMNPMTVSKMQLQRLQEIVDSGFGFKRADPENIHESVEDAAGPSFMQQYAALLAAKKVQDEIKEATELVANLGHAVRQRASELLLEGPLLSLKEGSGSMGGEAAAAVESNRTLRPEISRARMHAYSQVSDRSGRGVAGYEGWGWSESSTSHESNGEPVCVLEISPDRLEEVQGCDSQPFSAHLIKILNHASTDDRLSKVKDIVQYYPGVDVDVQGRESDSGGGSGGLKGRARAAHVVTTSLDGYSPLSNIVDAKGGIGSTNSGVRLARFVGRQVLRTLARIHGGNYLLRDLSLKSVFLPPSLDSNDSVIIGSLLHLGVLDEDGNLTNEAPDLDPSLFSLTSSMCPPEALAVKKLSLEQGGGFEVEFSDTRTTGETSGTKPATKTWDTWCFGAMLFELVTGKKIPSYGSSLMGYLGKSEQSGDSDQLLKRFHYDWIKVIGESKGERDVAKVESFDDDSDDGINLSEQKPGLQLCSSVLTSATPSNSSAGAAAVDSSLLASSALLASLANGFSYRALLPRSAIIETGGRKAGDQLIEAIRQKWIRLEMSHDGSSSSCCSWPELIEKMSRHARGIERKAKADNAAKGNNSGDGDDAEKTSHALKVLTSLDAADRRGLAPSVFVENLISGPDGIHGNGLNYPLTPVEAARLASCATFMDKTDSGSSEPLVFYEAFASIFSGYPHGGKFGGKEDPSSLLLDILALCFIGPAELRPTAETLLSHPFFTLTDAEEDAAMLDAKAYNSGAGPVNVVVQQHVVKPLHELTMQSAKLTNAQQKVDLALSLGATDIDGAHNDHLFDVGTFCDVLNSASSFLHGGGESSLGNSAAAEGSRVAHSSRWTPSERIHAAELMFSDELMVGGILPKIVACALRFVTSDQGSMTGYDFENAAAVGGSANATLGQRLMSRIVRFFESVLLETRPIAEGGSKLKDGPVTPYVSSILEALVKLYLGEEASLASIYGKGQGLKVDFSGFGGSNVGYNDILHIKGGLRMSKSTKWGPFGRDMEGVNHWSPNFMNVIEPVLLLAVTESGGGNHLYSPIVDFIRASKVKIEAGDEDTTAGYGDDDDDDFVATEGDAVATVKPFMRTSLYFSELVSLGRTFANLAAASRGQGRTGARARRSCVSFILTMVRLWGLKEGGGGAEGLSARPDALSSMQRAQLLLDVRVGGKLLPYVADYDAEVRRDVLTSALAALSTGMPLLGGNTGNIANPHAELGLEFCSKGWCEAFGKVLVSGGSTKDDAACRTLAAHCLERMASAGDVACEGWGVAGVVGNLGNALTDNRRAGAKDGALAVFEALASSSAPNVSKLLQAHPSIQSNLAGVGLSMPPPLNLPMLSQRGMDLAKGHTMAEVEQLVSMVRNLLSSAAQMDDSTVLGEGRPPESLIKLIGQIWGWFEVYWYKASLAGLGGKKDPHENARTHVLAECIDLFEFLVSGGGGERGAWLLDISPDYDVCKHGGIRPPGDTGDGPMTEEEEEMEREREGKRRGKELTKRLLMDIGMGMEEAGLEEDDDGDGDGNKAAGNGLTALVTKMGRSRGGGFEAFRADKLVGLKVKVMHAVASGMKSGGSAVVDKLLNSGVALYFGEAMHAGALLVKNAINSGSEHIHLATNYADACAARARMWECLLVSRSRKCAEQILLSGVCELIVGVMLRDEKAVDVTNVVIDLQFAPFNGKRICRNEAIGMLVACKKGIGEGSTIVSKAVVGEIVRQLRKYDTVAQERESLWRMGGGGKTLRARQARSEVIRVMRAILSVRSSELVRDLQFIAGVGTDLLEKEVALWSGLPLNMVEKKHLAAEWVKWAKGQAEQYDSVRVVADEDNDLFKYDSELRELVGRGGRAGRRRDEEEEVGQEVKAAITESVAQSMGVGATAPVGRQISTEALPAPVERVVSAPAATAAVAPQAAPSVVEAPEVAPPAAPSKKLCTIKVVGPPEKLSLQKLLNGIAVDVGCDDNEMTALSVRRGIQKGGKGEATIVELSVNDGVATSIHARARAAMFLTEAGSGLTFVSVEIQSMGRIDNKGNEVFGGIDDDMEFGTATGSGSNNAMSMSAGLSNFYAEAPMDTYVSNLRMNRGGGAGGDATGGGRDGVDFGTQYSARSGGSRSAKFGGGGQGGGAMNSEPATLPLLLDRLGGAIAEMKMVYDSRCSDDGTLDRQDIMNGLLDLRIDPMLARDAVKTNSNCDFHSFVLMHAKAAGYDGSGDESGNGNVNLPGEMWVENGSSGRWLVLGGRDVGKLRRGFDNFAERFGTDSDKSILSKNKLKRALHGVGGLVVSDGEIDKYLGARGGVLNVSRKGESIIGFQEFCRCWLEFGGEKDGNWAVENMGRHVEMSGRGEEGEYDMYDEYEGESNLRKNIDVGRGLEEFLVPDDDEMEDFAKEERYANLGAGAKKFGREDFASSRVRDSGPGFKMSGGGAHWAAKQQEKKKAASKFKGGERSLLGMSAERGDDTLRDELRGSALKRGFKELSGGRDRITMGSLRVAMAKRGDSGGEAEDEALRTFIESRGGNVRDGLTERQFNDAYKSGRGGVVGGSVSLPYVDDGSRVAGSGGVSWKDKKKDKGKKKRYEDSDDEEGESEEEEDSPRLSRKEREGREEEIDELTVDPFTEEAIRKTFAMYDLNSDGVISYLELKTIFQQQGRDSSDYEIRSWIRSRDSSGTGSVNFADFRRNYLLKQMKR